MVDAGPFKASLRRCCIWAVVLDRLWDPPRYHILCPSLLPVSPMLPVWWRGVIYGHEDRKTGEA